MNALGFHTDKEFQLQMHTQQNVPDR